MKKKMKKYSGALLLGLLAVGGGVMAMPTLNAYQMQDNCIQNSARMFEKNPERFLQTENLGLKRGFEITEEENYSVNEEALKKALDAGNYEAWREAMKGVGGSYAYTDVITQEDFQILASLHKLKEPER